MAAGDINDAASQIPGIALADDSGDPSDLGAGYALLKFKNGLPVWLPNGGAVRTALARGATSQLSTLTEEASPAAGDIVLLERASDGALRKVTWANLPGGGGYPTLTVNSAALAADATISVGSFGDVLSLALAAGSWLLSGVLLCLSGAAQSVSGRLTDHTTTYAHGLYSFADAGRLACIPLVSDTVVLAAPTTVYLQAYSQSATTAATAAHDSTWDATHQATYLRALRVA